MKKYLRKIRWFVVVTILLSFVQAVLTSATLLFPGLLIDNYQKGFGYIWKLVAAYIIIFLLYLLEAYIGNRVADHRRIRFEKAIKKDFFDAVIGRDFQAFHRYDIAEYISMQANDITEMCQNYLSPLLSIYNSVIMLAVFCISLVIHVNLYVALMILGFSAVVVFVPKLTAERLADRNKAYLDGVGQYTATAKTLYEAHDILDSKGREKLSALHEEALDHVLDKNMFFRRLNSFAMVLNGGSVEAISVITFVVVAILLLHGRITLGMATIAFTYATKFIDPMYEMNVCMGCVHSVRKIEEKLMAIIGRDVPKKQEDVPQIRRISATALEKNYEGAEIHTPPVELDFPKKYLVRGENGAGKSVFFRLLMHFEEADAGEIRYNGEEYSGAISESICYVPQNPIIFHASYEENVTVYHTYDAAKLGEYEAYFPQTVIEHIKSSTDPQNLSGGEKQVIAILRALCSGKEMILMDEPFAAMNQITLDAFMKKMDEIHRMLVIIAHNIDGYADRFDECITVRR